MCGIAGCVGHEYAPEFVTESLIALQTRGYDSAGVAYIQAGEICVEKVVGRPGGLLSKLPNDGGDITTAIAHNRWATHGEVTETNAHPHLNNNGDIGVVQNGTVDNHLRLREELISEGYKIKSETDTELIPNLIDLYRNQGMSPEEAFEAAIAKLAGANAVLAVFKEEPNTIYAATTGSTLVLGVNGDEHYVASQASVVLADGSKKGIPLEDHEMAILSVDGYRTKDLKKGVDTTRKPLSIFEINEKAELGNFPHFMLKEIYDQPSTVRAAISGRILPNEDIVKLGGLEDRQEQLRRLKRLIIVACGTSRHAGLMGERLFEEIANIPVEVKFSSEFNFSKEPIDKDTAVLAISQSGETADTVVALKKAAQLDLLRLGINNTPGSKIDRMTDAGVHCRAGEEVSVASTKAFTAQVTVLTEMALALSKSKNSLHHSLMEALVALPNKIEEILKDTSKIEEAAEKYAKAKNFLYIGRGYEYITAMEGALKLTEISYIHAQALEAGEMKHGPIALIDEDFPTMAIATDGEVYDKTAANISEIRARKGPVIALASEGNEEIKEQVDDVLYVPKTIEQLQPILNGVVLQLFAYHIAVKKGLDVDLPRNLAKSVTVE